jgi:hypothetical protein
MPGRKRSTNLALGAEHARQGRYPKFSPERPRLRAEAALFEEAKCEDSNPVAMYLPFF